jgi:hypothetical protein
MANTTLAMRDIHNILLTGRGVQLFYDELHRIFSVREIIVEEAHQLTSSLGA